MRKRERLGVGETYAYLTVVKQVTESSLAEMRVYRVRADCCGAVSDRRESLILDTARKNRATCQACRTVKDDQRRAKEPGEQFGPVVVVSGVGPWVVRWLCCGDEAVMTHRRLMVLRNQARYGRNLACRSCSHVFGAPRPVVLPQEALQDLPNSGDLPYGLISAALAWPRPQSLVTGRMTP